MCLLQDIALETAIPRSAICRISEEKLRDSDEAMLHLENGEAYNQSGPWYLISGSRAEGLTLEDDWGYAMADVDNMIFNGGPLGVYVAGGQQAQGKSGLVFRPEGCPPAYCKLEISDLNRVKKSKLGDLKWFDDSCVDNSGSVLWLHTYNTVHSMKDAVSLVPEEEVSGPAAEFGNDDYVQTLVCSSSYPDFHEEYRNLSRGPWPNVSTINYLLELPMMLVLVGHKLSPEFKLQARVSWSHLECKLIKELSESIRQGYIACKYIMKRFLKARRCQNVTVDGRSHVGSYHIKTVFLRFLEQKTPQMITSPFRLFLALLCEFDKYLKMGKLPHYFLAQCDLLETVGDDERRLARQVIQEISADPLNALLTSPLESWLIYGKVCPDHLVNAFHAVSSYPVCEHSWKHLSAVLTRVDEWRQKRYRDQRELDRSLVVSEPVGLIELVATLRRIKHC